MHTKIRFNSILKHFIFTIFTLVTIFAFSAHSAESNLSVINNLATILSQRVIRLDRDLVTFHYEDGKNNFDPQNLEDIQNRFKGWPQKHFDDSSFIDNNGLPGTYVAIDPLASRNYGGTNPQLYVMTIKKGAKLLIANDELALSSYYDKIAKKIMTEYACTKENYSSPFTAGDVALILRKSDNPQCRELVIQAFKKLNIQGAIYNWVANDIQDCRKSGEAIVLTSSDAIRFEDLSYYSNFKKIEGAQQSPYVFQLFREVLANDKPIIFDVGFHDGARPTESIPSSFAKDLFGNLSMASTDYLKWKQEHIYKCGKPWAFEK